MDGLAFDSLALRGRNMVAAAVALCRMSADRLSHAARLHNDIRAAIIFRAGRNKTNAGFADPADDFAAAFDKLFPDDLTDAERSAKLLMDECGPRAGVVAIARTLANVQRDDAAGARYWRDTFDAIMQTQSDRDGHASLRFD